MIRFLAGGGLAVKICGITNEADARMCVAAGAGALGFNFFPGSKRYLEPSEAIPWIRKLGESCPRIAVVVNPTLALLAELEAAACFEGIQFHGDESPEFCAQAGLKSWIKAVRVRDLADLESSLTFPAPAVLLDAWTPDAFGGTGKRLDWDLVRDFTLAHQDRRFILAGGLDVSNVRQAVRIVRPAAVDVASGVEVNPRKKEEYLVREFIRQASVI